MKENSHLDRLAVVIGAENSTLVKTTTMNSLRYSHEVVKGREVAPLIEVNSRLCVAGTISILISVPHPSMNSVTHITLMSMHHVTINSLQ